MKKIILTLSFLAFIFSAQAQLRLIAGVGADLYVSKYIWDDDISSIDLNDLHKKSFNFAPHVNLGIDVSNRFRLLTGFGISSRADNFSATFTDTAGVATEATIKVKNVYNTIPISATINVLGKESKSRLPIGACVDIGLFSKQVVSSDDLDNYFGSELPITNKYADLDTLINKTMISYGLTLGYGYQITDNFGFDILAFAKYDASDFNKSYKLYDHYAFVGVNVSLFYTFGKKE